MLKSLFGERASSIEVPQRLFTASTKDLEVLQKALAVFNSKLRLAQHGDSLTLLATANILLGSMPILSLFSTL